MQQNEKDLIVWYADVMSKLNVKYDLTFTSTEEKNFWLILMPIFLRDFCMDEYIKSPVFFINGSLESLETLIAKKLCYPSRLAFIYYLIYLNLMGLDMKKIYEMLQFRHIPLEISSISSKIAMDYINRQIQWSRNRHVVTVNNSQQQQEFPNKNFEEVLQVYLQDFCMEKHLPKTSFAIVEDMIHKKFNRDQKNQFFNLNENLISLHLMGNDSVSIRQKLEKQFISTNDNFPIDQVVPLAINDYFPIDRVVVYIEKRISWERLRPDEE